MSSSTTVIGDRRRQALERAAALRRHPTRRPVSKPTSPPTAAFYAIAVVVAVFVMLGLVMVLSASSINHWLFTGPTRRNVCPAKNPPKPLPRRFMM